MKRLIVSLFVVAFLAVQSVQASPYDLYFDTLLSAFIRRNEKYIDPLALDDQSWVFPLGKGVDASVTLNFTEINLYGLKRMHRSGPIERYTKDGQNVMDVPLASTNITLHSVVLPVMALETRHAKLVPVAINTTMDKLECLVTVNMNSLNRKSDVEIEKMENLKVTLYNARHPGLPDVLFQFLSYSINGILQEQATKATAKLLKKALQDKIDTYPSPYAEPVEHEKVQEEEEESVKYEMEEEEGDGFVADEDDDVDLEEE